MKVSTASPKTSTRTAVVVALVVVFGLSAVFAALLFRTGKSGKRNVTVNTSTVTNANTNTAVSPIYDTWVNINPGAGGEFTSIEAGPTGVIIAGSDLSGAYRSTDRGAHWDVIGSYRGLKVAHVSTVAFDPVVSTVVYLGTEAGIYRSDNTGDTFTQVTTSGYVGAIAPARSNTQIVYAGVHSLYNATDTTVYKSTDRGLSWSAVSTNLPVGLRVLKLLVDPTDPSIVFLVSGWDRFVPAALMAVYKSVDGGATWNRIAGALGDVWDFAMDQTNTQNLYLTTYVPAGGGTADCPGSPTSWRGCVFKSTDGGQTWVKKKEDRTGVIFVRRDNPQVIRTIDIQRDVTSSRGGVFESTDGGATWNRTGTMSSWDSGWQNIDWAFGRNYQGMPKTLGVDLSDPNVMLLADTQFVFAAFDGARFVNLFTNQVAAGLWRGRSVDNVAVLSMAQSETAPSHLYAGYYDLGLWRSVDNGESWQSANNVTFTGNWFGNGGNTTSVVVDPARADVVWATMGESNELNTLVLVKSASGGAPESWAATVGLPTGFIYGLSLDRTSPSNQRTMFVTDNGDVYRSQDDGQNWSRVLACGTCRVTAVDRINGQIVYAGGDAGLWRSADRGTTWNSVGVSGMFGTSTYPLGDVKWTGIHSIVPDPQQSGKVYAVAYGTDSNKGLYRSTDQGATWTKLRTCKYCRLLAIDPRNPNTLYLTSSRVYKSGGKAADSESVVRSTDGGATWTAWNEGLAWPFVGPVMVDAVNSNRVYIGAPGTGFFRRDISVPSGGGSGGGDEGLVRPNVR